MHRPPDSSLSVRGPLLQWQKISRLSPSRMPMNPLVPGLNWPNPIPWPPRWSITALKREYIVRKRRRNYRPHLHSLQGDGLVSEEIRSWKLTWWTGNRAATFSWVWDIMSSLAHSWEGRSSPGLTAPGEGVSQGDPPLTPSSYLWYSTNSGEGRDETV
jgi:hypothetical protein